MARNNRTPSVDVLPDFGVLSGPEAVRDATAAAREAGYARDAAERELRAAEAALTQAEAADLAADQAAVAAGKRLPTAKAGPKAREAIEQARRRAVAAEHNYAERFAELTQLIRAHRDLWVESLRDEGDEAEAEAIAALAAYQRALDRTQLARGVAATLERWFAPDQRDPWYGVSFGDGGERRERRRQVKREGHLKVLNNTRRQPLTEAEVPEALLDLELLASANPPWATPARSRRSRDPEAEVLGTDGGA